MPRLTRGNRRAAVSIALTIQGSFFGIKEVSALQGWTDVLCCAVLLIAVVVSNQLEDKKVEQIDVARQTAQDYVRGLPLLPRSPPDHPRPPPAPPARPSR